MGIFEKFKKNRVVTVSKYQMVTERGEGFYSWNGNLYKSDIVRAATIVTGKHYNNIVTGGMPANVSYDQIVYAYEQLSGGPSTSGNDWGNLVAHRANLKYLSSWANLRTGK